MYVHACTLYMYVCVHVYVGGGGAAVLGCSESAASRVRLARFGGKPLQCCQLYSVQLPDLLPQLHRALYLDVDTLVQGNVLEVWQHLLVMVVNKPWLHSSQYSVVSW